MYTEAKHALVARFVCIVCFGVTSSPNEAEGHTWVHATCRYVAKSDWEVTHKDGEAFKALQNWMNTSGIVAIKSGRSYVEHAIGYM